VRDGVRAVISGTEYGGRFGLELDVSVTISPDVRAGARQVLGGGVDRTPQLTDGGAGQGRRARFWETPQDGSSSGPSGD
jgi:hypothetical protein